MPANTTAARILSAQMRLCEELAAARKAASAAGASASKIADLEAQEQAARRRYQELAVDMPNAGYGAGGGSSAHGRRPWWRFWER
jgi:hypothetical protein